MPAEEKVDITPSKTGSDEQQAGDPGRTPGTAEGDRETVEETLEQRYDQEMGEQKNRPREADDAD